MRTREELTSCSVDNTMRRTGVSIRAILNNTLWSLPQMGSASGATGVNGMPGAFQSRGVTEPQRDGDRVAVDEVDYE